MTEEQALTQATQEIEEAKPMYAQVNNERREFTDTEYDQAIQDRKNSILDTYNNGYKQARLEAFLSLGDQLDQLYWDIDAGKLDKTVVWYKAIKKIKDDNPKPE